MNIFRYKNNGLLYLIYRSSLRSCMGSFYEAVPYNHNTRIGILKGYNPFSQKGLPFKQGMSLSDFEKVAFV